MKKTNKKILIITCIVCLLPIIIGLVYEKKLPDRVVIHFDVNKHPDGYATRNQLIYGIPVIMMIVQVFCCVISDLNDKSKDVNKKTMTTLKWIIPVLTVTMYVITLAYALGKNLDIRRIVMIILGVMLLVTGNYMQKNTSKVNTRKKQKINKISIYALIVDGILSIMTILTDNVKISIVVVALIIIEAIILSIYTIASLKNKSTRTTTRTSSKTINSSVKVEVKTTTRPAQNRKTKKKTTSTTKRKQSTNKKK